MSQLIVQSYKLSRTALKTKNKSCESRSRSPLLRFTGKSEQNFWLESTRKDGRHPRVVHRAMHPGKKWCSALCSMQCILVKSEELENSYSLLYILFKSWLCCRSLATLARSNKTAFCVDSIYGTTVLGYNPRLPYHRLSQRKTWYATFNP